MDDKNIDTSSNNHTNSIELDVIQMTVNEKVIDVGYKNTNLELTSFYYRISNGKLVVICSSAVDLKSVGSLDDIEPLYTLDFDLQNDYLVIHGDAPLISGKWKTK